MTDETGDEIGAELDRIEAAVASGDHDLRVLGFWRVVRRLKLDPDLTARHAAQAGRIDRAAFQSAKRWRFPVWLGNAVLVVGTVAMATVPTTRTAFPSHTGKRHRLADWNAARSIRPAWAACRAVRSGSSFSLRTTRQNPRTRRSWSPEATAASIRSSSAPISSPVSSVMEGDLATSAPYNGAASSPRPPRRERMSQTTSVRARYQIMSKVASGGMGEVYRARDSVLARYVASKVLHRNLAGDPGFIERCRREARAAALLSHPNIVAVHDWGSTTNGTYFMVMEFIRG